MYPGKEKRKNLECIDLNALNYFEIWISSFHLTMRKRCAMKSTGGKFRVNTGNTALPNICYQCQCWQCNLQDSVCRKIILSFLPNYLRLSHCYLWWYTQKENYASLESEIRTDHINLFSYWYLCGRDMCHS